MGLEALERHGAEESRRDDAIGVDVVAAQGHRPAGDARDGPIAHDRPPGLAASAGGEGGLWAGPTRPPPPPPRSRPRGRGPWSRPRPAACRTCSEPGTTSALT